MKRQVIVRYILLGLMLAVTAFFVAQVELTPNLWPISLTAIFLFSLPVSIGTISWLGPKKGTLCLLLLGLYAFVFESIAVVTGVPYGHFSYSGILGPQLGVVPMSVFLAWTPLIVGVLSLPIKGGIVKRIISATLLLVTVDMVLDPAAVHLGFWAWEEPSMYYGVPIINFVGWVISGGVALAILAITSKQLHLPVLPSIVRLNLLAIIAFWSLVNFFAGQYAPFVIGVVLACLCAYLGNRQLRRVIHLKHE